MRSFLICVVCMGLGNLPSCLIIPMVILSANISTIPCLVFMMSLDYKQKPNWPISMPSLVFSYNSTPHSTTEFKPYELMFGCKAPMPCDCWLGFGYYEADGLKSKTAWLGQQLDTLFSANKQALKLIHKSTQCSKACVSRKELFISVGKHFLLWDHPKGQNKIHDRQKSDIYVVVGHHDKPNMYYVQLLNKDHKSHRKVVNHHQIYDLNRSTPPSESMDSDAKDNNISVAPSFLVWKTYGSNNTFFPDPLLPIITSLGLNLKQLLLVAL